MPLGDLIASRANLNPALFAAGAAAAAADAASTATTAAASSPAPGAGPLGGVLGAATEAVRGVTGMAGMPGMAGWPGMDVGGGRGIPGITGPLDDRFGGIRWPVPVDVGPATFEARRPSTQLAQNAIGVLRGASRETLHEATQRVRAKQVPPERLVDWLERKTRIGEVLAGPASGWSQDTVADFAQAFQMAPANLPVMDAIVAMAVLNWPDLEGELRQENTPAVTGGDLLQNRRVVYQYPAPGTPLEPPYVILVAVEHQDTRRADEIVASILGSLGAAGGFKMPREAAAKIS